MSEYAEVKREDAVTLWTPGEEDVNKVIAEGIFHEISREVGINKSTMYSIKEADNGLVGLWGTTVLSSKLERIELGSQVRITYLGKRKSSKSPKGYHDFKVETTGTIRTAGPVEGEELFSDVE